MSVEDSNFLMKQFSLHATKKKKDKPKQKKSNGEL